ncbi:Hypothetical_protein [Hexamita inflata]|uniref:Hypothetical_protein n=1 Tax=Hexamita inflata TaxID=28002 RepID=A0AA86U4F8_9EUKA|nr:Hypothetical protein HINF_LOCUS29775 [Hexamita inflata]
MWFVYALRLFANKMKIIHVFFTDSKIPVYKTFSVFKMQHQSLPSNLNESQSIFNHFTSSSRRARCMYTNVEVTLNYIVQLYRILKDFSLLMKCSFLNELINDTAMDSNADYSVSLEGAQNSGL